MNTFENRILLLLDTTCPKVTNSLKLVEVYLYVYVYFVFFYWWREGDTYFFQHLKVLILYLSFNMMNTIWSTITQNYSLH